MIVNTLRLISNSIYLSFSNNISRSQQIRIEPFTCGPYPREWAGIFILILLLYILIIFENLHWCCTGEINDKTRSNNNKNTLILAASWFQPSGTKFILDCFGKRKQTDKSKKSESRLSFISEEYEFDLILNARTKPWRFVWVETFC